jgi:ribosomal protein S18 acetylase RimI-like enzyme
MIARQAPLAFALPAVLASQGFRLRPETDDDVPFLQRLYASTRSAELAAAPWSEDRKQAFVADQFHAQRLHYRSTMPDCRFDIVEHEEAPAGRLYLETGRTRLHVVDIALMPRWQGRGTGTAILRALQSASADAGKGVAIFVEKFNPALRLYRRLGFTEIADHGIYLEMEWLPERTQLNVA